MAVRRHSHSPAAKGTRKDVLSGELLSLHQVMLIDIAVSQIQAGVQISVDHMRADRTDIDPVFQLKVFVDMSAVRTGLRTRKKHIRKYDFDPFQPGLVLDLPSEF